METPLVVFYAVTTTRRRPSLGDYETWSEAFGSYPEAEAAVLALLAAGAGAGRLEKRYEAVR